MAVYSAGTIGDLRALAGPFSDKDAVVLEGYYALGDGGGGTFAYSASSTATDDGALVIKPASVSGAGRWLRLYEGRRFNVKWWGAKCDNSTDDTAAIQAAINFTQTLTPKGGDLRIPGQSVIATQLVCKATTGVRLVGDSIDVYTVRTPDIAPASCLVFTSTGTGLPVNGLGYPSFIDARSSNGFEMDGLGVIQNSGAFTGLFVDLSHDNSGTDAALARFTRCAFVSANYDAVKSRYTISARAAISFSAAIECVVEKCIFDRVLSGVRGQEEAGASISYSNVITIRDCQFSRTPTAIMNPGQNWLVEGCTFEGLMQSASDYMHHAVNVDIVSTQYMSGLFTFRDNWCGDAFGDQVWVRLRDAYNTVIESNLLTGGIGGIQFFSVAASSPSCGGISIRANSFSNSSFNVDFGFYKIGAHSGTGSGKLTFAGNPSGAHHVVVRIDTSGPPGVATWSYSLDGGAYVSAGSVASLTNLGGVGIDVYLDGDIVANCFVASDTYAMDSILPDTSGTILWNGCVVEGNELSNNKILARPSKYDINFLANRQPRPGGVPASPNINGVWIQPALAPNAVLSAGGWLLAWYKADALTLNDGDPVATWPDSSGHGWHLTQSTASLKPTFHKNTQNGLPVVRFDGVDDKMVSADMGLGAPCSVVVVFTARGSYVNGATVIDGNTSGANTMRMYRSGIYQMNLGGSKVGMFPARCGVYAMVHTGQADGSSSVRAGDFVVQGDLTNVIANIHSIVVGMDGAGAHPFSMDVAEIAIFDRYLYPDEIVGVMNALRAKWQCV